MIRAYLRVSTDDQAESGLGLAAQEASCRVWAAGAEVETYTDAGVSGGAPPSERPALVRLLAAVRKGDVLLVAKRDRLARDPYYAIIIERAVSASGGRVVSAAGEGTDDDSPTSILMRRILDAFAEHERLLIGVRTKAALGARKAQGKRVSGRSPLGWRFDDGAVVPDVSFRTQVDLAVRDNLGLSGAAAYLGISRSAAHRALVAWRAGWPR